jgi:tRNA pseudouridine55 synthase
MSLFGFLCCNKPPGMTSRDVVNIIQRRLRREGNSKRVKIGHAGTLDPLAEGVLVVAIGPASRLVPFVQQQPKHYRATFLLGQSTDSGDLEGEITHYPDLPPPSREQIDQAAAALVGTIQQTPPAHSAIWVDGQRAYKRVRSGESVQMPSRTVEVCSLDVPRYEFPEVDLDIVCGSGTYIRSIGMDLAIAAGSAAVMSHLIRVAVGPFVIDQAVSVDQLREDNLQSMVLPPTMGVGQLQQINIDDADVERLGLGKSIAGDPGEAEVAALTTDGRLRAILRWKDGAWYPSRVFPIEQE